jgi:hypothetical protein
MDRKNINCKFSTQMIFAKKELCADILTDMISTRKGSIWRMITTRNVELKSFAF